MMKRRFLWAFLAICMIISLLPGFAGAADAAAPFTYTAGDGTVSSYIHLAEVFTALNSDASATAATPGVISQQADYVITNDTPKMAATAVILDAANPFVWDMGGHSVTTESGFTLTVPLMHNGTADHCGTVKNGSIRLKTSTAPLRIGDAAHSPKSDLTFENVQLYANGASVYVSYADGCRLTLDGGSCIANTDSKDKQTIRMITGLSETPKIRLLLKGGVLLEKEGHYGYNIGLKNTEAQQVYILNATISSYASYIYASSRLKNTAVLLLTEEIPVEIQPTSGQKYEDALMQFFTTRLLPNIYDPAYQSSTTYKHYTYTNGDVTQVPITLQSCQNGSISCKYSAGVVGHLLEFDVKPEEGYCFSHLLINGEKWNSNRITVPHAESITVGAEFVKITETDDVLRDAILQTALAYHYKGKYVQYDSTNITIQQKNTSGIGRMTSGDSPEMAAKDHTVYSVCSDFMYDIFKNALNYELMGTPRLCRTAVMTALPKDYPTVVYKYGGDAEKNLDAFYASRQLLQPGDILVAHNGSSGHAMLYAGDIYGTGVEYIIHCGGRKINIDTGVDAVEASGAIWVDKVTGYVYSKSATYSAEKYPNETFAILRPLLDPAIHKNLTDAAKTRLQYEGIGVDRSADVVKYNSLTQGQTVEITTTVTNHGKKAFSDLVITEPLPLGVEIDEGSISSGGSLSASGITWTVAVPAGKSISVTYQAAVTAACGEGVTFPISAVATLPTRELTFRVGGGKLNSANLAKLSAMAAGTSQFETEASQTAFAADFYRTLFGVELPLPGTISQLQSALLEQVPVINVTDTDGNRMWRPKRRDTLSKENQQLYDMVLPEHFTGLSVYLGDDPQAVPFSMAARNRVLNFVEDSYEPGDILLGYNKPDVTVLTQEGNSFVYIYLGGGKVAAWDSTGGAVILPFSDSVALCMRASFLIALRPSLVYDNINTRVSAEAVFTQDSLRNAEVRFSVNTDGTALYAVLTKGGTTQTIPQSRWTKTAQGYTVAYTGLGAKEMADPIRMQIFDANGMLLCQATSDRCSGVAQAMAAEDDTAVLAMYEALLEYGAAAQTFFGYNTESLANRLLDKGTTHLTHIRQQLPAYRKDESSVTGSLICGTSLILGDTLTLRFYMTDGTKTVLVNHAAVQVQAASTPGYYYCDVPVSADAFCQPILVEVKNGSAVLAQATDSVASYCSRLYSTGLPQNMALSDAILTYCMASSLGQI